MERDRNDTPMWIAQRCKWEHEKAVERGETRVAEVLAYCLNGATFGRKPAYIKPEPMSNTVRFFNSLEDNK